MMPSPRVGCIVLTYNRSDALLAVLRSLARQCRPGDVVVVADDGSRPEHVTALRAGLPRFDCRVVHAWHPDVGFTISRARNLAVAQMDVDYLLFLDGDCVPTPHFLQQHLALARPGHFVTGSRVLLSERLTRQALRSGDDLSQLSAGQWLRLRLQGDINKLTHLCRWPGAPGRERREFRWKGIRGCNMAMWREDFVAVNGFDESFHGWGHEDADIVLRLHQSGLARLSGYLGTEVLHLWHRENSRADEQANRQRVLARQQASPAEPRAVCGLTQAGAIPGAVVTELN